MNEHLDKIDNDIAEKHLLKHPFYLAWTRGELSREALTDYARQYYHHVAAFPTYLSAVHAKCDDQPTRKQLLDNLSSGRLKYAMIETRDVKVTMHGDAAVVRGVSPRKRAAIPGSNIGDAEPFNAFYTLIFVNQGGVWKAVAMHTSRPN